MYNFKTISSPLGLLTLVASDDALIALYVKDEKMPKMVGAVKDEKHPILLLAQKQLEEYFKGKRRDFDIPVAPEGTEFQARVWKALTKIPYGKIWSYGEQAKYLKAPNAQRAVGGANGKNPIPIIIPCHRVIGSTGKLTGFAGGMAMKVFLLKLEGHEVDPHGLKISNGQMGLF